MFNITSILSEIYIYYLFLDLLFYKYWQFCRLTIDEYIFIGPLYDILWL